MKKIGVFMLALLLALPVVSYGGNVTNKWDLVIGGCVKLDMGYNSQALGPAVAYAERESKGGRDWAKDETGNFFMGAGETALSFLIKGPDAWGAKTRAFISATFNGRWSKDNYGDYNLGDAWIRLDWPNTSIEFGQKRTTFVALQTWAGNMLNFDGVSPFNKGTPPTMQLMLEQRFAKDWAVKIGVINSGAVQGSSGGYGPTVTSTYSNSEMPFFGGDITYSTDACGKVGIWKMLFSIGGFYGKERRQYPPAGTPGPVENEDVDSWLIEAKASIPIIPQKKEDKKGALLVAFNGFTAQNPDSHLNTAELANVTYRRGVTWEYAAPVVSGGFSHIQYYLTNNLYLNGFYGHFNQNWSRHRMGENIATARVVSNQHIIANIMYDVNPALRIGFEYGNIHTKYAYGAGGMIGYENKGTNHQFRIGALYFF